MVIIFAIPDMGMGGAERVISKLANDWASQHAVIIVTLHGISSDFYILDSRVERVAINLIPGKWYQFFRFVRIILRLGAVYRSKNPDYILSFLPKMNILSLVALFFSKKKLIICERNIISESNVSKRVNFFRKLLYKRAYKITVQHADIQKELLETFPSVKPDKVIITPNPVEPYISIAKIDPSRLVGNYSPDNTILISVGRFTAVKAHKDEIYMFAFLKKRFDNIKLIICGDGKELDECRMLVKDLQLDDSVYLPGLVGNIGSYYAVSDIFVTTTYFEGFPNALTEALAAGLPVVAFSAPSVSVFVKDGYNGYVIPGRDNEKMADCIQEIIMNKDLYTRLSHKAREISNEYSMEIVDRIWMEKVLV
jgi:glycosyltransferase involved in cell wall biosynthesis